MTNSVHQKAGRRVAWGDDFLDVEEIVARNPKIRPATAAAIVRLLAKECRRPGDDCIGGMVQHLQLQIEEVAWSLFQVNDFVGPIPLNRRRKAKKRPIGRRLAKAVFERDEYRCRACTTHLDLTVDHIVPESQGGETTLANLQTLCRPCNSRKGVRL
jgi:hypothetical protein